MSKKKRALTFGVFLGVFLAAFSIGTVYKMSDEEANKFLNDFQNQTQGIDAKGIFFHNAPVALGMFVPAAGVGFGAYSAWSTGAAFSALENIHPELSQIIPISILFNSPYGVMELVAYSIGMSRSFIVIWRIIKKNPIKKEIRPSLIEIGISIGILVIAAFVESAMTAPQHVSLSS